MSVVLKSRQVKFRNTGSEDYYGISAISEEKTTDMLQQIEQKGQEVKNSIPSDYTELSQEVGNLKNDLSDIENGIDYIPFIINLNKTINTYGSDKVIKPENIKYESNWCCVCVSCSPGDVFHVTGIGGAIARLWAFSDTNGTLLEGANSGATGTELAVTAPNNSAYFAFNSRMQSSGTPVTYEVYKGSKPYKRLDTIEEAISGLPELKESVPEIEQELSIVSDLTLDNTTITDDIGSEVTWTDGFMRKGGSTASSDTYHYCSSITVRPGDVISTGGFMRFVTAFVDGVAEESLGAESVQTYTVPDTVNSVIVTIKKDSTSLMHKHIKKVNILDSRISVIEAKIKEITGSNGVVVVATANSMSNGDMLKACENIDNKKGDTIVFYADVDSTAFTSVTVGHGYNINYGASVTIDSTNISINYGTSSDYYHTTHGLTIDKFLMVEVIHGTNAHSTIRIYSVDGSFELASSHVPWGGCRGDVFALSTGSNLSNVKLTSTFADFKQDIFLFGDSYVSLNDLARYSTLLVNNGYTNIMIDGYGGRNSQNAIKSFRKVIALAKPKPKFVIWALGMNDPDDNSQIDTNYKTCLDEVLETCQLYDITPILATIPTVSTDGVVTRDNEPKNQWIRSHDYRYIDFAKAVGAGADGVWYDGMLEAKTGNVTERVHPTQLGAKALYARFLIDVPEIASRS